MRETKQKCKSKTKLLTKKQLRKRDLSLKAKKNKSRRRSCVPQEKRKTIIDHIRRKESVKKHYKHKWECLSDSSDESHDQYNSESTSPKQAKAHFKRMTLDSSMKCDSVDKSKTVHKEDYFKSEFKKAHSEILEMRNKLSKTKTALELKTSENNEIKQQFLALKKKFKHYKYYKEKTKEYKLKLKQASKEMQELEIENNRKYLDP